MEKINIFDQGPTPLQIVLVAALRVLGQLTLAFILVLLFLMGLIQFNSFIHAKSLAVPVAVLLFVTLLVFSGIAKTKPYTQFIFILVLATLIILIPVAIIALLPSVNPVTVILVDLLIFIMIAVMSGKTTTDESAEFAIDNAAIRSNIYASISLSMILICVLLVPAFFTPKPTQAGSISAEQGLINGESRSYTLAAASEISYHINNYFDNNSTTSHSSDSEKLSELTIKQYLLGHGQYHNLIIYEPPSSLIREVKCTLGPDWEIRGLIHEPIITVDGGVSGNNAYFSALILTNEHTSSAILAYTGTTDMPTLIWEDFIGFGMLDFTSETINSNVAAKFFLDSSRNSSQSSIDLRNIKNFYITGHSLGGLLAQYGAAQWLCFAHQAEISKLKNVEVFNSPGFSPNLLGYTVNTGLTAKTEKALETYSFKTRSTYKDGVGGLISHEIQGDQVSLLGHQIGKRIKYSCSSRSGFIALHNISNWVRGC